MFRLKKKPQKKNLGLHKTTENVIQENTMMRILIDLLLRNQIVCSNLN